MSSVNVKSIDAINDFNLHLKKFAYSVYSIIRSIKIKIQQLRDWLNNKKHYLQRQVENATYEVNYAKNALYSCLDNRRDGCSYYESKLNEALRHLRELENKLRNFIKIKSIIENEVDIIQSQLFKLDKMLKNELVSANSFLDNIVERLSQYVNVYIRSQSSDLLFLADKQRNFTTIPLDIVNRIPLGFECKDDYLIFKELLISGFKQAGYSDFCAIMQGSSVTGTKFDTGEPFDEQSDYDVAIANLSLFNNARNLRLKIRGSNNQPRILIDNNNFYIAIKLGIDKVMVQLSDFCKRPVNFMLYRSKNEIIERSKCNSYQDEIDQYIEITC